MTPDDLLALAPEGVSLADPAAVVAAFEAACDANPRDRRLAVGLLAAHGLATAEVDAPPVIAGVRRSRVIRWDPRTVTWDGVDVTTGQPARIRALRRPFASDPVVRRTLLRDGRLLTDALSMHVTVHDDATVALRIDLPGAALASGKADPSDPGRLPRQLITALAAMRRAEVAGVAFPPLSGDELVDGPDGIAIACLTLADPSAATGAIGRLAAAVVAWWGDDGPETPVDVALAGMVVWPPRDVAEAEHVVKKGLIERLTADFHDRTARFEILWHEVRRERLLRAVEGLSEAVLMPEGRGAVGVSLDGSVIVLVGVDGRMRYGTDGADGTEIYGPAGFAVSDARRLLRARAAAPPNARLHAQVGGDERFVDAACRWIASGLALRTTRLLLEARR